jgi:hypothetical protein
MDTCRSTPGEKRAENKDGVDQRAVVNAIEDINQDQ